MQRATRFPAGRSGIVDVYDVTADCRHPDLMSTALPTGVLGHEAGFAPDGKTYYTSSLGGGTLTAVDLTEPRLPRTVYVGRYDTHSLSLGDDGNTAWKSVTIPQNTIPVTIKGHPYVVETDELALTEDGEFRGNAKRVGAARIIDIADPTRSRVVSNMRLEVHQPENRDSAGSRRGDGEGSRAVPVGTEQESRVIGWVGDIEQATLDNETFRTVLHTGSHLQLTVMRLGPGEEIGREAHPDLDQFIRIEAGRAMVELGASEATVDEKHDVADDWAVIIPAGIWHNVVNTGTTDCKLYSIYAPPEHPAETVHRTKAEADAAEEEHHRS